MPMRSGHDKRTDSMSAPERLLLLLKRDGPADAESLASLLGVTGAAIRQHLYALRDRGLVRARDEARPMGRPAKIWALTLKANERFPCADSSLLASLLRSTQETLGEKGMSQVLCACVDVQVERYQKVIAGKKNLGGRLRALVAIRSSEGFMADLQRETDGTFLMTENHCPISHAVDSCSQLCNTELEIFRSTLGRGVRVDRLEHMAGGDRRCAYRIEAVSELIER